MNLVLVHSLLVPVHFILMFKSVLSSPHYGICPLLYIFLSLYPQRSAQYQYVEKMKKICEHYSQQKTLINVYTGLHLYYICTGQGLKITNNVCVKIVCMFKYLHSQGHLCLTGSSHSLCMHAYMCTCVYIYMFVFICACRYAYIYTVFCSILFCHIRQPF